MDQTQVGVISQPFFSKASFPFSRHVSAVSVYIDMRKESIFGIDSLQIIFKHRFDSQLYKLNMEKEAELRELSSLFLKEMQEMEKANTWQLVHQQPCLLYTMEKGDRLPNKLELILNFPFQTVLDFLKDPEKISRISEQKVQTKILYEKDQIRVLHVKIQGFWPVSDRQMVVVNTLKTDGTKAYIGSKSCNFGVKEDPDIVRMEVIVSGSILQKTGERQCKLTSISDVDIKGSIPNFIKNKMATKRASSFAKLEKTIGESLS